MSSVLRLRLDIFHGSSNVPAAEGSFPKKTAYRRLSNSLFSTFGMNPHCVSAWRWSTPVLFSNRRIKDLHLRRRIVTAVAVSMSQAVESDTRSEHYKEAGHCDEARNVDGNRNRWSGACMPSSIPGKGTFRMALTVLPSQEGSFSYCPTDRNPAVNCQGGVCLDFAHNASDMPTKEGALFTLLQKKRSVRSCLEEDTPIIEAEKVRRKKISEANKGKVPWNKGKKIPKGALQFLDVTTAVAVQNLRDLDDDTSVLLREKWRRQQISQANKGKVPWNKGRRHSEETKQLIRARTMEAMQDPNIRKKLHVFGLRQSLETRLKISKALISRWNVMKKIKQAQESCVKEWEEMIADVARKGDDGDEVYRWNSYATRMKELRVAWKLYLKERKRAPLRVVFSSDHKTKISEAIKAKWSNPKYRLNVEEGIRASLVKRGINLCRRVRPSYKVIKSTNPRKINSRTRKSDDVDIKADSILGATSERKSDASRSKTVRALPAYQNPSTQDRLEKLRQIRASRLNEERMQREATERARMLIAEAKRAAMALEAAAVKDKNALATLIETRRLLAEAARSFETVGLRFGGTLAAWKEEQI